MRRHVLMLCVTLAFCGGSSLSAQSLWSPCGCPDQSGSCQTTGCAAANCQPNCQPGCHGCGHGWCSQWHDPTYFQPWEMRPFGYYNERIYEAQRQSGVRAQLVFHRHHFALNAADGTWQLTQAGQENAQKLARLWTQSPSQILVESSGNAEWDNVRRDLAINAMTALGVAVTPEAFVIGKSHILGLVPYEPQSIFERRQQLSPYFYGVIADPSVGASSTSGSAASSGSSGSSPSGMSPRN